MSDTVRITQKQYTALAKKVDEIENTKPFIYGEEQIGKPIDMALTNFWFDVIELDYISHHIYNVETNELTSRFYSKTTNKHATTIHKDYIIGWRGTHLFEDLNKYFTEDSDPKIKEDLSMVISHFPENSPEPLRGREIKLYNTMLLRMEMLCKSFLCLPNIWKKETLTITKDVTTPEEKLMTAVFRKREVRLRNVYTIKNGISIKNITPSKHLTCPCWGVRGHYRHLTNGKTIFIKPYKKGKHRDKEELQVNKDYVC